MCAKCDDRIFGVLWVGVRRGEEEEGGLKIYEKKFVLTIVHCNIRCGVFKTITSWGKRKSEKEKRAKRISKNFTLFCVRCDYLFFILHSLGMWMKGRRKECFYLFYYARICGRNFWRIKLKFVAWLRKRKGRRDFTAISNWRFAAFQFIYSFLQGDERDLYGVLWIKK